MNGASNPLLFSTYSSINDLNDSVLSSSNDKTPNANCNTNGAMVISPPPQPQNNSCSIDDSLIELKINEVNARTALLQQEEQKKQQQKNSYHKQHRRMHSFPNIQINMLKKNSMMQLSPPPPPPHHLTSSQTDLKSNNTNEVDKTLLLENNYNNNLKTQSQIPKIYVNDDSSEIIFKKNEEDEQQQSPILINDHHHTNSYANESNNMFDKTTIFDFIHTVQIQSECSTLDKENSHFIMADLAIASHEIIKTNELFSLFDQETNVTTKKQTANRPSNNIKIRLKEMKTLAEPSLSFDQSSSYSPSTNNNSMLSNHGLFMIDESKDEQTLNTTDASSSENNSDECKRKREAWQKNHDRLEVASQSSRSSTPNNNNNLNNTGETLLDDLSVTKSATIDQTSLISESSFQTSTATKNNLMTSSTNSISNNTPSNNNLAQKLLSSFKFVSFNGNSNNNSKPASLTDDGFEVVKNKASSKTSPKKLPVNSQETIRTRRYSWEEIKDEDSAQSLANILIKQTLEYYFELINKRIIAFQNNNNVNNNKNERLNRVLNQMKKSKQPICSYLVPKLSNLEFFLKYLEYDEYVQSFLELRNSGKIQQFITKSLNSKNSIINENKNISASSMYLSHLGASSVGASTVLQSNNNSSSMITKPNLFGSSALKSSMKKQQVKNSNNFDTLLQPFSPLNSNWFKIKSAALTSVLTVSLIKSEEENNSEFGESDNLRKVEFENSDNDNEYNDDLVSMNESFYSSSTDYNMSQSAISSISTTFNSDRTNQLIRQLSSCTFTSTSPNNNQNDLMLNSTTSSSSQLITSGQFGASQGFIFVNKSFANPSRIIGDEMWAPVREQLILNQTKKLKRLDQIKLQHFRCADCGIQVRPDKIKTFYFCEYFGKYFCRCCHTSNQSYIPAHVINSLDFRTNYEVSKKAKNFLEKIYNEPLITLESLNPSLFESPSSLFSKVKRLRLKLYNSRTYINSCRLAIDIKEKLYEQFDDFFVNDQHVYSIAILFKIKKSNFTEQMKNIIALIIQHIKTCEICSQQGYICGLCTNNNSNSSAKRDLLYPFDIERVEKCPNCLACYHIQCFKSPENCPRCERIRNRKIENKQQQQNENNNNKNNDSSNNIVVTVGGD